MNNLNEYVQAARNGDTKAYEELYKQTYYVVYYTCFNLLKNEQDALDVTQDVYVTVMNQLYTLNDTSKFVSWLNRIAVNKCMDLKKKNHPVIMDTETMEQSAFFEENECFLPEEYVQNQEKRQLVLNIMRSTLSEKEYETIFLYYFNGLSVKEISSIMECPEGTVTYRLSTARGKIKNGVISYEKISGDKLYSTAAVPFLASFFAMEIQMVYGVSMPSVGMQLVGTATVQTGITNTVGKVGDAMMKKKIIAGIVAGAIIIGGAAAAIIVSQKDKNKKEATTEQETDYDYSYEYEEDITEYEWEDTTENTEELTTEEETVVESLEVKELKEYSTDGIGVDSISGTIKDIAEVDQIGTSLIILTDSGHLYSYYMDGFGYYICDLGQPSWMLENLDCISYNMSIDSGEITIIDGNHYYCAEIEDYAPVKVVDSVMLEGKTIRTVGLYDEYSDSFVLYCDDGSYYSVSVDSADTSDGPFVDSENYLIDNTGFLADVVVDGLEVIQREGELMICSGGTLYLHKAGSTGMEEMPAESTKNYVITSLYKGYCIGYDYTVALTDTNELLILENDLDVEILYTLAAPESEIIDLWYNNDILIVKTADGYYSCDTTTDTTLVLDETWNSLTSDVVDIYGKYVLLNDGYVYEFPEY